MEQTRGQAMPSGSSPVDYTLALPPPKNEAVPDKGSTLRRATDYLKRCSSWLVLAIALAAWPAAAQQPVHTVPQPATSAGSNASGTITATGVFQPVWAASSQSPGSAVRKGCTIQNNSARTMYVTEGLALADSTTGKAVALAAGVAYFCNSGGTVLTGQINITGTIGDGFYAAQF